MKKYFKTALTFAVILSVLAMLCVNSSAATLNLINNDHEEINLLNPIANVQIFSGDAVDAVSESEDISVALFDASEISDISSLLTECKREGIVPTFKIDSTAEADAVVAAMGSKASRVKDVNVVSDNTDVLSYIREKSVFVRSGLITDIPNSNLTSKEADEFRKNVRSAPATFCVVGSENATKKSVSEIQILAVAVWVEIQAEPNTDEFTLEVIKAVTSGANGIISTDSKAVASIVNQYLAKNTMTRTPVMIGHRGNPSQAPENSLSGFITAYENGADIFEIDVEITADSEIIILHDGTLNRTTNYSGTKNVGQMKLSEIKEYRLLDKNGNVTEETVPTLKEVLEEFKGKDCRIFVEFKGSNIRNVSETAKLIKEYDMEDQVDVISFNAKLITETQKQLPGMSTGFLCSYSFSNKTMEDALDAMYRAMSDAQKANSTINIGSGAYSVHFQQAATDRGMTVWPWTYLAGSNNSAFIAGCDGLTTDDVQWAKDMAKYIETDSLTVELGVDSSAPVTVNAITYGGETVAVSAEDHIVTVLAGSDCISVENGEITGIKEGKATVIYGYPTETAVGSKYVLYTQPVTINVTEALENSENSGGEFNLTALYITFGALGVAALAAIVAVVVFVIIKKKK